MPHINQASLHNFLQDDDELLAELASMFVQAVPDHVSRLQLAIFERNSDLLTDTAHRVYGQLKYFMVGELQEIAAELEQDGKSGSFVGSEEKLNQLLAGIDELVDELRELTGLPLPVAVED